MKTLLWGIVWTIAGCWMTYAIVGNPLNELALIQRAQTVPGFITEASEEPEDGVEGGTHWFYSATYQYRTKNGREYTQSTRSHSGRLSDEFRDLKQPYPIEVEYLPDKPNVSRIKGSGSGNIADWLWRTVALESFMLALLISPGVLLLRDGLREIKGLPPKSYLQ